jgi:UDP-3-O-[3-hydroxymyristoyl] glucosamine N-acyltransferase
MQATAQQIAAILGGTIEGDPNIIVYGPSKIEEGKEGTITFLANPKYEHYLYDTKADIVLLGRDIVLVKAVKPTLIRVENVYASLAILLEKFDSKISISSGISAMASVAANVKIGSNVSIDDFCIIKPNVTIGDNTKIHGQVFLGDNVKIGNNTTIMPGAKIYHNCIIGDHCIVHANVVIGSDGFGFAQDAEGNYLKIAQTGNVILENNVEIGSNTVIDRATMGSTIIQSGAKLDNLIQIAHNVNIGQNTVIAAQTGIAGSAKVGQKCMIGGQVGIIGHIKIADGTMIQAQSGISSTIEIENSKLYGSPAIEFGSYLKSYAYFKKLPELMTQLRQLQSQVDKLKSESIN